MAAEVDNKYISWRLGVAAHMVDARGSVSPGRGFVHRLIFWNGKTAFTQSMKAVLADRSRDGPAASRSNI